MLKVWVCTTLFAIGIIGGMTYLNLGDTSPNPTPEPKAQAADEDADSEFEFSIESEDPVTELSYRNSAVKMGDRYLLTGNFVSALDNYYEYEKATPHTGSAILLREAFCFELQRRYVLAQKKYYRATTVTSANHHRLLGLAGMTRCLLHQKKHAEALEIIADQVLRSDELQSTPEEVRAQIGFQFAKSLEAFATSDAPELTSPLGVSFENHVPVSQSMLNAIDAPVPESSSVEQVARSPVEILQRPSSSLSVVTATLSLELQPIEQLMFQMASSADLELFISQRAEDTIKNRSKTIRLNVAPLSFVFDALLAPFDLAWYQIDSQIHVVSRDELYPTLAPNQSWFDAAQRAFRRFQLTFHDDGRLLASHLSQANLNLLQKNFDEAAYQYQELDQAHPDGEVLAKLFFNRGKLEMLLGQFDRANRDLYFAVDQTQDPDLAASGYCHLGANLLSSGDLANSIRVSRRAISIAVHPVQKQIASLNLARAYLMNNEPFAANNALFENREAYDEADRKSIASILGSYAQFVGVSDEYGVRVARNRLISAVSMVPETSYRSFVDCYVAAQAFERLGFRQEAIDRLVLALAQQDIGSWQHQVLFDLGTLQKKTGQTEAATQTFKSVIEFGNSHWHQAALEQLAQIFVETKQVDLCIATCKQLWAAEMTDHQKQSTLQMLGSAYQMKGEHYAAALCFAGMLPETF